MQYSEIRQNFSNSVAAPELGKQQYCRDNGTLFFLNQYVAYCVMARVSQFRFKKRFASKRNLAKQKQFRFLLQFRETTKKFRLVSLSFAS